MGCAKRMVYVKSRSGGVWGKGLQRTGYAQRREKWLMLRSANCWQVPGGNEPIPGFVTGEEGFPFLYLAREMN
jgi:hypothetical protein